MVKIVILAFFKAKNFSFRPKEEIVSKWQIVKRT